MTAVLTPTLFVVVMVAVSGLAMPVWVGNVASTGRTASSEKPTTRNPLVP